MESKPIRGPGAKRTWCSTWSGGCVGLFAPDEPISDLGATTKSIGLAIEPVPVETLRHSNDQHHAILRAVDARRPEQARQLMTDHLQTAYEFWVGRPRADELQLDGAAGGPALPPI